MKVTNIKPVEIGDILALTERPYHYKEVTIINRVSGRVDLRQNYYGCDGPANGPGTWSFDADPLVWTEEGLAASGARLVTDAAEIKVAQLFINQFHGMVDAAPSAPARELMAFIQANEMISPIGQWRNGLDAETKLTEWLQERVGREARKEVCRQLLAAVDNLQRMDA